MLGNKDGEGFIKFLDREEWAARFGEVLDDHVGPTLEMADLDLDMLAEQLGEDVSEALWTYVFEDMLTREFEGEDGGNIVDAYLKQYGAKVGADFRARMTALRHSVLSLYEVSDVVPGQSFEVHDLIRGGEPVLVSDGEAAGIAEAGEQVAVRIIRIGGKNILGGGVIPFSPEMTEALLANLRMLFGEEGSFRLEISDELLRDQAYMFTEVWLEEMLGLMDDEDNDDGEAGDACLYEVSFPLASGVTQKVVAERIEAVAGMVRLRQKFWVWQTDLKARASSSASLLSGEGGEPTVSMEGRWLKVTITSADQVDECEAKMRDILGDFAGEPQRSTHNMLDMLQHLLAD